MTTYTMTVIPKPKDGTATAINWSGPKGNVPLIKGEGSDNYICGTCENVICENVTRGQIKTLVMQCPNCHSYNQIKGT